MKMDPLFLCPVESLTEMEDSEDFKETSVIIKNSPPHKAAEAQELYGGANSLKSRHVSAHVTSNLPELRTTTGRWRETSEALPHQTII
jgi:hypothetical protein